MKTKKKYLSEYDFEGFKYAFTSRDGTVICFTRPCKNGDDLSHEAMYVTQDDIDDGTALRFAKDRMSRPQKPR